LKIVDFTADHIQQASILAKQNYEEARGFVPALPHVDALPNLSEFAENEMGVAAFEGERLIGFLCSYIFDNAFGTTNVKGTWSPIHAHAAVGNKGNIYQRLYQAAAEKWVDAGALSHAITFYAHNETAVQAMFTYGFGLRCIDAIKLIEPTAIKIAGDFGLSELPRKDAGQITMLQNRLADHMGCSPCFLSRPQMSTEDSVNRSNQRDSRIFIAQRNKELIAFLEIAVDDENFACDAPDMLNICGAYLMPEYRGKGVFDALLSYAETILAQDGCRRLGVDFESFNPTALGFWLKHFTAYTRSVVRRIDEGAKQ